MTQSRDKKYRGAIYHDFLGQQFSRPDMIIPRASGTGTKSFGTVPSIHLDKTDKIIKPHFSVQRAGEYFYFNNSFLYGCLFLIILPLNENLNVGIIPNPSFGAEFHASYKATNQELTQG